MKSLFTIRETSYCAVFVAFITAGAYISFPIGPVPIVLQNFFILLAALFLKPRMMLLTIFVYLLAGLIGLPVFSGGKSGAVHFLGPTGGFLIAYVPASFSASLFRNYVKFNFYFSSIGASLIFIAVVYIIGIAWMIPSFGINKAIAFGLIPFIIPDIIKAAAAITIDKTLSSKLLIHE
ncbi:MAG: biotin transporter BioY [Spirochaetes bacterium]|nr:biotin transporter BioY [Spirochaetota bacterium]